MKTSIIIFNMVISIGLYSQIATIPESDFRGVHEGGNAFDRDSTTYAYTNSKTPGELPWLLVELENTVELEGLIIELPTDITFGTGGQSSQVIESFNAGNGDPVPENTRIQNNTVSLCDSFHIFITDSYHQNYDLEKLLNDPWYHYYTVSINQNRGPGVPIPVSYYIPTFHANGEGIATKYIYITSGDCYSIQIRDIITIIGPGIPNVENDCADNSDNDDDGLIDCNDSDCGVGWFNITSKPSTSNCGNGQICVQAVGADQISLDGGQSWNNVTPYGIHCFDNLIDGNYDVIARKESSNCSKASATTIVLLIPKESNANLKSAGCEGNIDFETGTLQDWEAFSSEIVNGNIQQPYQNDFPLCHRGFKLGTELNDYGEPVTSPNNSQFGSINGNNSGVVPLSRMLQKCFTVDNINANFSFNYSFMLEDGDTDPLTTEEHDHDLSTSVEIRLLIDGSEIYEDIIIGDEDYYNQVDRIIEYENRADVMIRDWICCRSSNQSGQ